MEVNAKIGLVRESFSTYIGGRSIWFEKGEMVWMSDFDHLGMAAICKHDKPFVTYSTKDWVEEFFIEWQRIR